MSEQKVEYGKHIDVFILSDGRKGTIIDYIDIKIADGLAIRVCLVELLKGGERILYLDKQLVAAFDKHESDTINSYNLVWFYDEEQKGKEEKIIGDGNLLPKLYDICGKIKSVEGSVNKVMILVQRAMSITV
jgi:hypothetical protein